MSCCFDPSCREGSLCNPTPNNDDRAMVYNTRATLYEDAADELSRERPDKQVNTTLATIALELRENSGHWRKMVPA
jgi:hypothetical protein